MEENREDFINSYTESLKSFFEIAKNVMKELKQNRNISNICSFNFSQRQSTNHVNWSP
jgi:hypothetical protein